MLSNRSEIFEILHDLVTKRDGVDIAQGRIEKGLQIIFLFAGRNGGDDLIEIEVEKKSGALSRSSAMRSVAWWKRMLRKVTDLFLHAGPPDRNS